MVVGRQAPNDIQMPLKRWTKSMEYNVIDNIKREYLKLYLLLTS